MSQQRINQNRDDLDDEQVPAPEPRYNYDRQVCRNGVRCNVRANQNQDDVDDDLSNALLNMNLRNPLENGFRPTNCRSFHGVTKVRAQDTNCFDNKIPISQFQVYCREELSSVKELLREMRWPIPVRLQSNYTIPGFALIVSQRNPAGRYTGESYWIGWQLPYWMSLPSYFLSDDEKRKLSLYWIARQRLYFNLFQFTQLSVMLCTYYPNSQQFNQRRERLQEDHKNLFALQRQYNGDDSPEIATLLQSQPENLVYVLNGGKGADMVRNKNIPLSYMLNNGAGVEHIDIQPDDWLTQPFPRYINGEPDFNGFTYVWTDMYELNPDVFQDPKTRWRFIRQNVNALESFLLAHRDEIQGIIQNFQTRVQNLYETRTQEELDDLFQPDRRAERSVTFQKEARDLFQEKEARLQENQGNVAAIALQESRRLMGAILKDYVPQKEERFNSSSKVISPYVIRRD